MGESKMINWFQEGQEEFKNGDAPFQQWTSRNHPIEIIIYTFHNHKEDKEYFHVKVTDVPGRYWGFETLKEAEQFVDSNFSLDRLGRFFVENSDRWRDRVR
jgi:hypothetical protein